MPGIVSPLRCHGELAATILMGLPSVPVRHNAAFEEQNGVVLALAS